MEAIKRLELEMQQHRKTIDEIQRDLKHEKSELQRTLKKINEDVDGENDALNYGFVYEYSDKICTHIKSIKELQKLILMKMDTHTKYSSAVAEKV